MDKNTSKFDESFIKHHNDNSDKGYIFKVDVEYLKELYDSYNDLSFSPERMKISQKLE